MTWYRTLGPITYTDGDRVRHVTRAGIRIDLDPAQAAELAGMIVLDQTTPLTYPRADFLKYESAVLFPVEGIEDAVYLANDSGLLYRWINDDYAAVGVSTTWEGISGKPSVIAQGSTQADAQAALGGTATGRAVFTAADDAAGRTALGAVTAAETLEQTADYAVAKLPAGHYTPTGKSNGAVGALDSGQAVATFGDSPGVVSSGVLVTTATGSPPHGTYYQADMGATVRRMGCEVKWPTSATGALAFVLPVSAWGPPGGHPSGDSSAGANAGVHLTLYGNGIWDCGSWNATAGTVTSYASSTTHGRYGTVWDGEFHDVEIWVDPDAEKMTVRFPDGSFTTIENAAIGDVTSWVIWEQFESNTVDVPCVLRNLWADTEVRRADSFAATKVDIAEAVAVLQSDAYDLEFVTTSGGTETLDSFSATMQVFTGSASHTVALPTTDIPMGKLVILVNASTGVITVNSSNGSFVTALAAGGTAYVLSMAATPTMAANWLALPFVTTSGTQTLTSKRLDPRVTSTTSASSLTPSYSTADIYVYTALAANLTINAPSGTTNGGRIRYRFKDDGVSRTLTWNAIFRAIGVTLPAATTAGKWMYVDTVYNSADTRWDVTDVKIEA